MISQYFLRSTYLFNIVYHRKIYAVLPSVLYKHDISNIAISKTCSFKRGYSSDTEYGKFSDPGKLELFYEWFTDTSWIQCVEKSLITAHDFTSLPWWASIILSTVVLRSLVMTPMFILQMKYNIKYQMFLPIFAQTQKKLSEEVEEAAILNQWDSKTAQRQFLLNLARHRTNLYKKYKVPGIGKRFMLPWVQIPLWFSMSISLRHLAGSLPINTIPTPEMSSVAMQLSQEGCLWFQNLCDYDYFYILPVLLGVVNLSIIEIYRGDGQVEPRGIQKFFMYTARTLSLLLIPVACVMPTAVVVYWLSSSTFGATQALVFRSPKVRKFFKIPVPLNESKTPYKDIFKRFSRKKIINR